jgi:orotate phosphoribosyltransferase
MANTREYEQVADDNVRSLLADMTTGYRERLGRMLRERSLGYGDVLLSSGQKSNYYFDCKLTTLDPEGAYLTGHAVMEGLKEMGLQPEAIGGMTMGADPIVSATIVVSSLEKKSLPGFLIRKEPKEHGKRKQIEGFNVSGREVVIIDEVCTTGKSIFEAIDAVIEEKGHVIGIISLLDREEGGSIELRKRNYNYHSIFTARQLMDEDKASPKEQREVSRGR